MNEMRNFDPESFPMKETKTTSAEKHKGSIVFNKEISYSEIGSLKKNQQKFTPRVGDM